MHLDIYTASLRAGLERSEEILDRGICAVKYVAVFLSSAASSDYINGHTIAVDGGWLAR